MNSLINRTQKFITDKRQRIEQARTSRVRRIYQDIQRISSRELEYSKELIETIVPVKISWNDEAWKKIQEFIPIKIEEKPREEEDEDGSGA